MAVDAARAKSLFLAASDLNADDRAVYLDRECGGDAELRERIEALLRANDAAPLPPASEATVDSVAGRPGTEDHGDPTAQVGAVLAGKFKLVEEIGAGGMGSVFLAQQTEPVKRAVAVKVIKAGMDSKAVLARFDAERQALALMDHPNIARVLDAGTTDGGRPFFVMELVKGVPITEYCDARKLTPKQRLELFVPVCQAIQHAHQKGIIHRDIKPSNVLIALYDDRAVPKVIDFGVAKATGTALTDLSLMTGFGAVVGTPEYMSPEQASLNNLDIDTRSDVYALGVLLYELLTGTTPVDRKSLKEAALLEVLRIVREVEAPRPSDRLSTIDTLPNIAADRGTEPAKLSTLMKGELDLVVLKALEKQRERRYETANALARDIQRFLADEPVEARPPSASYRLRKFLRRNRAAVATAGAVAGALLLGAIVASWQAVRATRAEREERAAKEQAEKLASDNAKLAEKEERQRKRAEGERAQAIAARNRADEERRIAETARYALQLKLATHDLNRFEIDAARQTLARTRPELRGWEYGHMTLACDARKRVFANDDAYGCVALSPSGELVAGGNSKRVCLWDFGSRRLVAEFEGDGLPVEEVAFSPNGERLCAATKMSVHIWDVASKRQLGRGELDPPAEHTPRIAFAPMGDRVAVAHGPLRVWNAELSEKLLARKPELTAPETGAFTAVAFDPQGKLLAVQLTAAVPGEGAAKQYEEEYLLLDAGTGKQFATSGRETRSTTPWYAPIVFDPRGRWFLATGQGGLTLRDPATAKVQRVTNRGIGVAVALSGDGSRMAFVNPVPSHVGIHKLPELETLKSLPLGNLFGRTEAVAMSADGRRVAAAARGSEQVQGSVTGWDLDGDDAIVPVAAVQRFQSISALTSSVVAGWSAVATSESAPIDPKKLRAAKRPFQRVEHGQVHFHSLQTGRRLFSLPKTEGNIRLLECSRDGRMIVTADNSPASMPIRIWDTVKRALRREIRVAGEEGKRCIVRHLSTDRDAQVVCALVAEHRVLESGRIGIAPDRFRVEVWETATGKVIWNTAWKNESLPISGPMMVSATLSPSGKRLIIINGVVQKGPPDPKSGRSGIRVASKVECHDLATNKVMARLDLENPVTAVFPPSGEHVYLGGQGILRWNPATGEQTRLSDQPCGCVLVSPDERRLISVETPLGQAGIIRWIDTGTRQEVYRVPNENMRYSYNGVHLTGDGRTLIVTDARKALMLPSADAGPVPADAGPLPGGIR